MRRLCGLMMFWLGVGMAIMLFFPVTVITVFLTVCLLICGYNLFCGW